MFKEYFQGKKALFFDLDGTIIDSIPLWMQAYHDVAVNNDFDIKDYDVVGQGLHSEYIWKQFIEENGLRTKKSIPMLIKETVETYQTLFMDADLDVRDGFWNLIYEAKTIKKLKIVLVSNSDQKLVMPVLAKLELEKGVFDLIVTGDQVRKRKPDPEIYIKAAKTLQLADKEILVFEDSISGVSAAAGANMDIIVIWDGRIKQQSYPGHIFEFAPDFSAFYKNMDTSAYEDIKKAAEEEDSGIQQNP